MNEPVSSGKRVVSMGQRARWWRRIGTAKGGFRYVDSDGHPVHNPAAQERIRRLAIPPAWTDVRISPFARSRIQALGIGARGKAQYIYHSAFVEHRKRRRFEKIEHFGEHLPRLRKITSEHLSRSGLGRERVMALVTRLVNALYFRVGSEDGVRRYRTYGITTLRSRHIKVRPRGELEFNFAGKHHVRTHRVLVDDQIARVLNELKALRGARLFKYLTPDGRAHAVTARDLNDYIKEITAPEFSAKDFRTWYGTLIVAKELARIGKGKNRRERKRNIAQAVKGAAERLGNTPAVCRRAYLHPTVVALYERGITLENLPHNGVRIPGQQSGYFAEEMQILDLFLLARELDFARRQRRAMSKRLPVGPAPASSSTSAAQPEAG